MIALGLLTASACCHAAWNLLVKRGSLGGPAFVWMCSLLTLPVAVVLLVLSWPTEAWWAGLISMALHTTYAVTLQKAYALGDFTTVYPVSRATAPLLVTVPTLLWSTTSPQVIAGAALTLLGVLMMDRRRSRRPAQGVLLGLLVASCTAAYTLWDGFAVTTLHVELPAYLAISNVAQIVLLSTIVRDHRQALTQWRQAWPVAVLMPASYGLVLLALSFAPVGAVAVGRTLNVVIGGVLGALVLRERPHFAALAVVVAGVLLVSI
ncbi:hypothetical protein [Kribbella sp. NPDC048928]|uniref:hypothetical protein n=1 Tax=Kribbella sp. NPDC048928 TaxID=3364111 RepID=UPI00371B4983